MSYAAIAGAVIAAAGSAYSANEQSKGQKKAAGAGDQDRAIKQILARWYIDQMGQTGGRTQSLSDAKTNGVWAKPSLLLNEFEQRKLGATSYGKDKRFFAPGPDGKASRVRYFTPQDLAQMRAPETREGVALGAVNPFAIQNKESSGFFGKLFRGTDVLRGVMNPAAMPFDRNPEKPRQGQMQQRQQQYAAYLQRLQQAGINPNGPQWVAPGYGGQR